ncbi:MAG: hypothetical protein J7M34_11725 [Anaerolineae bacterium]|nr:hypothetical protein [Anaerolineae bacterium]
MNKSGLTHGIGSVLLRWGWLVVVALLVTACAPTEWPWTLFATATPETAAAVPTPTFTPTPTATLTPTPTSTPTPVPVVQKPTATPAPAPTATPSQIVWIVTEDMINEAVQSGEIEKTMGDQLQVQDLAVKFADGRIHVSAGLLKYSFFTIRNLQATINLWAENGQVQMAVEQLQPSNLMTRLLPGAAAQALEQYTAGWYVEDIRIEDGQMTITVRP